MTSTSCQLPVPAPAALTLTLSHDRWNLIVLYTLRTCSWRPMSLDYAYCLYVYSNFFLLQTTGKLRNFITYSLCLILQNIKMYVKNINVTSILNELACHPPQRNNLITYLYDFRRLHVSLLNMKCEWKRFHSWYKLDFQALRSLWQRRLIYVIITIVSSNNRWSFTVHLHFVLVHLILTCNINMCN